MSVFGLIKDSKSMAKPGPLFWGSRSSPNECVARKRPNICAGSVTCLEFYKHTHLLSGSDDGTVCVWNARTWNCDKTLVAHKGGVTVLSVHPSGKLALTAGKDRALKTWNLIKGRTAYVTNIKGTVGNQLISVRLD